MTNDEFFTLRQRREVEYHQTHAKVYKKLLEKPVNFDIITKEKRRWWNAHWEMYTFLLNKGLQGKQVLVVGCGFGDDAFYLAKAGARVKAFDLSLDSLSMAKERNARENLNIDFQRMPAEKLNYQDSYFDIIVARDILHHVEIFESLNEIIRVAKPRAIFCFDEVYTHSIFERIRRSKFVDKWFYPKMKNFIYKGEKPYITEDERKLSEKDVENILSSMSKPELKKYFNFVVTRIIPDSSLILIKLDRLFLMLLSPIAYLLGSRVLIAGELKNLNT